MDIKSLYKLNVVAVDDEEMILKHLDNHISRYCNKFEKFTSAIEAYEYISTSTVDIVISDIRMPLMNGIEFSKKVKDYKKDIIVILLSASNDAEYLMEAINVGVDRFLPKPYSIKELIEILENYATQIESIKEVKLYNEFIVNKLNIKENNFKDILYYLEQYNDAINQTNLVRKFDSNGKIITTNNKFIKTLGMYSLANQLKEINSFDVIKNTTSSSDKFFNNLIIYENQNQKSYIESTYIPIYKYDQTLLEVLEISYDVSEVYKLNEEIQKTQETVIYMLGTLIESRSKETSNHLKRVALYGEIIGKAYGLDDKQMELMKISSPLHDIGKIGIPDHILNKPSSLSDEEYRVVKEHSKIGYEILKNSNRDILQIAAVIAYSHHENWDGTGYPQNLKGEEIDIYSRIIAVADVFDALIHDRCYKKAWSIEEAIDFIKKEKGKKFEPKIVDMFLESIEDILKIYRKYTEND